MRAMQARRYASPPVLEATTVEVPQPGPGQVLVKVAAAAVCRGDWHLATGRPYVVRLMFGFSRPKHSIPGQAFSGHVVAAGPDTNHLRVGDAVFGQGTRGAYAEYVLVDETEAAPAPTGVSLADVATIPLSGFTALQGLRLGDKLRPGARVLIHGASGGIGSLAVPMAKHFGAHVTGVCGANNVEFVASLGAERVLDYTKDDVTKLDDAFDLVLDVSGNISPGRFRGILKRDGVFVSSAGPKGDWIAPFVQPLRVMTNSLFSSRSFRMFLAKPNPEDLETLRELVSSGAIRPVVAERARLEDLPRLLRDTGAGHARGTRMVVP